MSVTCLISFLHCVYFSPCWRFGLCTFFSILLYSFTLYHIIYISFSFSFSLGKWSWVLLCVRPETSTSNPPSQCHRWDNGNRGDSLVAVLVKNIPPPLCSAPVRGKWRHLLFTSKQAQRLVSFERPLTPSRDEMCSGWWKMWQRGLKAAEAAGESVSAALTTLVFRGEWGVIFVLKSCFPLELLLRTDC